MGCGVSKFEQEEFGCVGALKQRHHNHGVLPPKERPSSASVDHNGEDRNSLFSGRKDICVLPKDDKTKKSKDDEDNGRDERLESEIGGDSILFPGSPSFREYCVPDDHAYGHSGSCDGDKSDNRKGLKKKPKNRKLGGQIKNVLNRGGFKS